MRDLLLEKGHPLCRIREVGLRRLLLTLAPAAMVGLAAEWTSLRFGSLFGARYQYPAEMWRGGMVGGLPLAIPLFWAVFVYVGYSTVNSFLRWTGKTAWRFDRHSLRPLACLLATDGIVVVAIDLLMDPLLTFRGNWRWAEKGLYFGVPPGNFAGWFMVVVASTACARIADRIGLGPEPAASDVEILMPVALYGLLASGFVCYAVWISAWGVVAPGTLAMGAVVASNLALFLVRARHAA